MLPFMGEGGSLLRAQRVRGTRSFKAEGELKSAQLSLAGCFPFLDSAVLAVRS